MVLRILERKGTQLTMLTSEGIDKQKECIEIPLGKFKDAYMQFSDDGLMFSICKINRAENKVVIQVFQCDSEDDANTDCEYQKRMLKISSLIRKIKNNESKYEQEFDSKYFFISKLKFDQNLQKLIAYGDTKVLKIDLEKQNDKGILFEIDEEKYGGILDLQFNSASGCSENSPECFIACRVNEFRHIALLSLDELEKPDAEKKFLFFINYKSDVLSDNAQVKISKCMKQAVLMDISEKYILDLNQQWSKGQYSQRSLTHMNEMVTYHISDPPAHEVGFYFIVSHEFDSHLRLYHSDYEECLLEFGKSIEPNIIKVQDVLFDTTGFTNGDMKKEGYLRRTIRVARMREDEFIMDRVKYDFKNHMDITQHLVNDKIEDYMLARFAHEKAYRQPFSVKNAVAQFYTYPTNRAYSVNWPYFAFSGSSNFLILINAFEKRLVHRIELAPSDQQITILDTCLTETNELFALILQNESKKTCSSTPKEFKQGKKIKDDSQDVYKLFRLDLDEAESKVDFMKAIYSFGDPIFTYPAHAVHDKQFLKLQVRGSSKKYKRLNKNQKLMAYFLHEGGLYSWTDLDESEPKQTEQKEVRKICCTVSTNFNKLNEDTFFLLHNVHELPPQLQSQGEQDQIKSQIEWKLHLNLLKEHEAGAPLKGQEILKISSGCDSCTVTSVMKDYDPSTEIVSISVDTQRQDLVLLVKSLEESPQGEYEAFTIKIYDFVTKDFLFETKVTDPGFIGRIMSGLFTYADGHIYFSNNVIKIRYDLIESNKGLNLDEKEVFDQYSEVVAFEDKNFKIKSGTPLDSYDSYKLVYIFKDERKEKCQTINLCSYPHERKIFLKKHDEFCKYFYTQIKTDLSDEIDFYKHLQIKLKLIEIKNKSWITEQFYDYDAQYYQELKDHSPKSFTSIIAINLTDHEYSVFSQRGVLLKQNKFQEQVEQYGSIQAISPNGLNLVFMHKLPSIEERKKMKFKENSEIQKKYFQMTIFRITVFGLVKIKEISYYDVLRSNDHKIFFDKEKTKATEIGDWISVFEKCLDSIELNVKINDQMDVCVQLKKKFEGSLKELIETKLKKKLKVIMLKDKDDKKGSKVDASVSDEQEEEFDITDESKTILYYFEKGFHNTDDLQVHGQLLNTPDFVPESIREELRLYDNKENGENDNYVFITQGHDFNFAINKKRIYLWDQRHAFRAEINQKIKSESAFESMDKFTNLSENDGQVIKQIIVNDKPGAFVVAKQISDGNEQLLIYEDDLCTSEISELQPDNYLVAFDPQGYPYVIHNQKVEFMKQRCVLTCFDIGEDQISQVCQNQNSITQNVGEIIDGTNNNWIMISEHISLGFCYLSFLIKDKIEKGDPEVESIMFDPEPYNYIFNKGNCFTYGEFVANDADQLQTVLEKLMELNEENLSQLHYIQEVQPIKGGGDEQTLITTENGKDIPLPYIEHTALHFAQNNNKSIDVILESLAQVSRNGSRNFISIISKLVEQTSFITYLDCLVVQTEVMKKKQFLRVKKPFCDFLINARHNDSKNVPEDFLDIKDNNGKKLELNISDSESYPVKMCALRVDWIFNNSVKGPNGEKLGKEFLQAILDTGNMEYFNIQAVQMIIEYLYVAIKGKLLNLIVKQFMLQAILFHVILLTNELSFEILVQRNHEGQDIKSEFPDIIENNYRKWHLLVSMLNLVLITFLIRQQYHQFRDHGHIYFSKSVFWMDLCYIVLNICISYFMFETAQIQYFPELMTEDLKSGILDACIQRQRYLEVLGVFIIYVKASMYLSLVDQLAPLMDIIRQIFYDIGYFTLILFFWQFCFATCFHLIGKSQFQFDGIEDDPAFQDAGLPYLTWDGALWFVYYDYVLGNMDTSYFEYGTAGQKLVLYILFVMVSFLMMIHLLNMLIAIMGESFAARSAFIEQIKLKDHLDFVLMYWYLMNECFKEEELREFRYIIAAFKVEPPGDKSIEEIKAGIQKVNEDNQNMKEDNIEMKTMITEILREVNSIRNAQKKK